MTRLEGNKPNVGAIMIGAIIFALVAAGLFYAFRPVPDPTDAGLSNSADATQNAENTKADSDSNAPGDESANSLATILTPLPLATPTGAPTESSVTAPTDNSDTAPVAASTATPPTATPQSATPQSAPDSNSVSGPNAP